MKIVILDGYCENPGDLSWNQMAELGELTVYDRTPAENTVERIDNAEIVITNKTVIDKAVLEACPSIKYIGVLATGYNVVDIQEAKEKGVVVTNIPAYGTDTVAQFTMAQLLEISCHVGHHSNAVHEGRWESSPDFCFWDYPLIELAGKTIGIVGFGKIGQATARLAQAFGMKVLANAKHRRAELETDNCKYVEIDELFAKSDVVSLHCPLTTENVGMINKDNISKMKDGVIILNTARGGLVNEQDLKDALVSGKVKAAAVDVVSTEPIKGDNALLTAPNCLITPHIAWASHEARQRLMDTAVENLKQYLDGSPVNVVLQ